MNFKNCYDVSLHRRLFGDTKRTHQSQYSKCQRQKKRFTFCDAVFWSNPYHNPPQKSLEKLKQQKKKGLQTCLSLTRSFWTPSSSFKVRLWHFCGLLPQRKRAVTSETTSVFRVGQISSIRLHINAWCMFAHSSSCWRLSHPFCGLINPNVCL